MNKSFHVRAIWDDEAKRFYSTSDIVGLHIETETLDEFEEVLRDVAMDLILSNHLSAEEMASSAIRDLLPIVVFERPDRQSP